MKRSVALGVSAAAVLLAVLPACGDDENDGGNCGQYYDALVAYYQRCNVLDDGGRFTSTRTRFLTVCANALSAPGAGNLSQRITDCSLKLSGLACTDDPDCETDTVGTLPEGSACLEGYQCASGGCDGEDDQCGKCVPLVAIGQPCSTTNRCVKGANCNYRNGDTGTCVAEVRAKAGESCKQDGDTYVLCERGLNCNYDDFDNPTCKAPGGAGTKCSSSGDCTRELTCKDGTCQAGSPAGGDCQDFQGCAQGLVCSNKKCAAPTYTATAGQPCDLVRNCARGRCKGMTFASSEGGEKPGTCEDPIPDGQPCRERSPSSSGGEDDDPPRCDTYAECINGTCQIPNASMCK